MSEEDNDVEDISTSDLPDNTKTGKIGRAALNVAGGVIPLVGGILSAAAGAWSEHEQDRVNEVFRNWIQMLEEELREKAQTIIEIMARLDMHEERIAERISSAEYQSLLKKAFRNWSNIESDEKRVLVRNLLANSAASDISSDDVVSLFLDWLATYSMFHFSVISIIYKNPGVTRYGIWNELGKPPVREDSADADLFKMLIRDLSMGGVIRQHRETDGWGNYIKKTPRKTKPGTASRTVKSAFDDEEEYELTDIGTQFVHYAMNEITPKIEFHPGSVNEPTG